MSPDFRIRKFITQTEEERSREGIEADPPLRKVIVAAVINNPYAGGYQEDLSAGGRVLGGSRWAGLVIWPRTLWASRFSPMARVGLRGSTGRRSTW